MKLIRAVPPLILLICAIQPVSAQCVDMPGCVLVWADEFDGTEVDLSRWTFQQGDGSEVGLPGGWGNNELQYYRPENATVSGGFLTITAKEEFFGGRNYTSARMRTLAKGDWTFGRLEMRARMPVGQGPWPAFWMLPSDQSIYGGWAAGGEIDIVEYLGSDTDRIFGTIHYGGAFPNNTLSGDDYILPTGTFADDFHVFAIEWEYGVIRWYVDDILYVTRNSWYTTGGPFPAPFDVDFHLLLNMAVGGNLPGPPDATTMFPQELVVDYVRVYQVPNDPPTVTVTSPTATDNPTPGDDLTVTVDATDDGTVEIVQFFQDNSFLGDDTLPPYELDLPGVAAGCYELSARARDDGGKLAASAPVSFSVGAGCPQAPYRLSPSPIPGTIEAEDFDLGGQGVAYNDVDPTNNGGGYRPAERVDLEGTTDTGFGFNVGWTAAGEWLEYTVDVTAGTYDIDFRVSSGAGGGSLHLEFDGVDKTGPVNFGNTGGWQNWTTVGVQNVTLDGGIQTMRLVVDSAGFNLNRISIFTPGMEQLANTCVTTNSNPCVRTGFCAIDESSWYQVVTLDRADPFNTISWTSVCNLVNDAMVNGDCSPPGAGSDVTANISTASSAHIPVVTGPLTCAATAALGSVPNGDDVAGVPLTVGVEPGGDLSLGWGASCQAADDDYVVYEGPMGNFAAHGAVTCSTGGSTTWTLTPAGGSSYYLVVPTNGVSEGSRGKDSAGAERPAGLSACYASNIGECL
jgi:beta-glucanase (GH16 family)